MSRDKTKARTPELSLRFDIAPTVNSLAAALASLAFFKPWAVFSLNIGTTPPLRLTGATLARQFPGSLPWFQITPFLLLLILLLSIVRLFSRSAIYRVGYAILIVAFALPSLLWPAHAMGQMTRRLAHLSARGLVKMELTPWWWLYAAVLVGAVISVIIDVALTARLSAAPRALPADRHGGAD